MNSFNERLKLALAINNISQSELCERTGIPKSAMSQYISGAFTPKQERTYLIAKALNVNEAWLLGYDIIMDRVETDPSMLKVSTNNLTPVPIIGKVAAGRGCLAEDNITGYIKTDPDILKKGFEHFWLAVKGDSMEPELHENDFVLVRKQETLEKPCFAVVRIDNEDGMIKRVDVKPDRITLISINPYYPPRVFEKEDMNRIHLVGKVVEIKRRLE